MGVAAPNNHRIRRGLDIPISGAPVQEIEDGPAVQRVAIVAQDYVGMRPRMRVTDGDRVVRGQALFEDRTNPGVTHTAPGAGTIQVHRGARRALLSVTIDLDESDLSGDEMDYGSYPGPDPALWTTPFIRETLQESGLWTALRTRPFSKVPAVDSMPRSIFVTASDSEPLAPRPDVVLAGREEVFEDGLRALVHLADGRPVYLCGEEGSSLLAGQVDGVEPHTFNGPHPAGTVGLHIHLLDPTDRERVVWHVGYQDVAAIGHFLRTGTLDVTRVVALAGPAVKRPRLIRTRAGAALQPLVDGELGEDTLRVLAGSVLTGRHPGGDATAFLGRYDRQISALAEDRERRFLGWLDPGLSRFSLQRLFLSKLTPARQFPMTTTQGGKRGMVPIGAYEKVMPFEMMPTFLLRALLAGDAEKAQELGCLELDEEDLALASFVCPSKIEYGPVLRHMLTAIEKEG